MKITRWLFIGLSVVCAAGLARFAEAQTHDWCSAGTDIHHFNFGSVSCEFLTDTGNGITPCVLTPNLSFKILGSPSGRAFIPSAAGSQGIPSGSSGIPFSNDIGESWWVGTRNLVQYDGGGCYDPYQGADFCGFEQYTVLGGGGTYDPAFGGAGTIGFQIDGGDNHYGFGASGEGRSTDINGDGDTDEADEAAMRTAIQNHSADTRYDLNFLDDGATEADLQILLEEARQRDGNNRFLRGSCKIDPLYGHPPCDIYPVDYYMGSYNPADLYIVAPAAPTAATATAVGGNWSLGWVNGGDDGTSGNAWALELRTSTSPITAGNFNSVSADPIPAPSPNPSGVSQALTTSYASSTTRYFAIRSIDDSGEPSTIRAFPPSKITNLSAVAGRGNIKLSWTAPSEEGGTLPYYDMRMCQCTAANFSWATATSVSLQSPAESGTAECNVVSGLDDGTTYSFAIKTGDADGNWSPLSNVVGVKTRTTGSLTYVCGNGRVAQPEDQPVDGIQVLELSPFQPNPSRSGGFLSLSVPATMSGARCEAGVYDLLGRRIAPLAPGAIAAGVRSIGWDLRDQFGRTVTPGLYYVRVRVGSTELRSSVIVTR